MRAWSPCAAFKSRVFPKPVEQVCMLRIGSRTSKRVAIDHLCFFPNCFPSRIWECRVVVLLPNSKIFSKLIQQLIMLLGGTRTSKKLRLMLYVSVQNSSRKMDESVESLRRFQTRRLSQKISKLASCCGVEGDPSKNTMCDNICLFQNHLSQ
jgi:hypothetical protein